jgi:hypothetical protein
MEPYALSERRAIQGRKEASDGRDYGRGRLAGKSCNRVKDLGLYGASGEGPDFKWALRQEPAFMR